jgi:hypothetical protein
MHKRLMMVTSEANCRQILRRAKQHVGAMRPRFKTSQAKEE